VLAAGPIFWDCAVGMGMFTSSLASATPMFRKGFLHTVVYVLTWQCKTQHRN
jgi:hypothetical protein